MNIKSYRFLLSTVLVCICSLGVFAEPPSLVNFRGQLLDSNDQPVNTSVSIDLRIFSSETAGTQLYLEQIGSVEVKSGQYAFQFGSNGTPDFKSVIRDNLETWVEITIEGDTMPRQRFVSVPYALNAGSSQINPGSITRSMLSQDIQLDLNKSGPIQPGSITREMLAPGVLVDGNGSQIIAQGGGDSIDNPFGWDGEIITFTGTTYTVPSDKVLVIVSGDVVKLTSSEAFRSLNSGYSIVPPSTVINSEKGWTGILNDLIESITPIIIKDSPFEVPVGKNLVLTSAAYDILVSGKAVGWMNSRFILIEQGKTIEHTDGFNQGALSGYLIDANKSLGRSFGGSSNPSQIALGSITREMLAPGVLVDGNVSQNFSQAGGNSISNPFGWDGVPVLGEQAEYIVPTGKVLIITATHQENPNDLKIEDNSSSMNSKVIRSDNSFPSFLPEGEKIITGSSGWTGFLVNSNNDYSAVNSKGESYTVPDDKVLIITSSGGDMVYIPSMYGDQKFRATDSPPSILPAGTIINSSGPGNGWSGYLTDLSSLAKIGSGSSATGFGFSSPSLSSLFMPFGYDGEVIIGGNTYTVPDGKVLVTSNYHGYVTIGSNSVNSFSRDSSAANDVVILPEKTTFTLTYNSSSASTGSGFVGMLFDQSDEFEAVYGGAGYTVPSGKKLYVTSAVGIMRLNGNAVSFRPTIGRIPMVLPSQTTFTLDTGPAQMNYGFSGYLVDENKTLGGGISGGGTAPIANASITRDMLSQEILDEINASITADRLSPEVSQKLNSSSQVSGQIISVPEGTPHPSGYTKVSDGIFEWNIESPHGAFGPYAGNETPIGMLFSAGDKLYTYVLNGYFLEYFDENSSVWVRPQNSFPPSTHFKTSTDTSLGSAGVLNNSIFVVGGPDDKVVSAFDVLTETWREIVDLPDHNSEHPPCVASVGNNLYVFSATDDGTTKGFKLAEDESSWSEIFSGVLLNGDEITVVIGEIIYFIGTNTKRFLTATNSVESNLAQMPNATINHSAFSLTSISHSAFAFNDILYVYKNIDEFYAFNPLLNIWSTAKNQPTPFGTKFLSSHAMAVHRGKIWFSGGLRGAVYDYPNTATTRRNETYSGTFVPALYAYTDTNSTSGSGGSNPAPGSVTTSMLSDTILKYLKPEITQQPVLNGQPYKGESIIVRISNGQPYVGEPFSLSVEAEGKYLTYQWKKDGLDLSGATGGELSFTNANSSQHDGNYSLVISNDFGVIETVGFPVVVQNGQRNSLNIDLNSSVDLEMNWVEPGTFTMGQTSVAEYEHQVTLTNGFYLGVYEVTQEQYETVMRGVVGDLNSTPSKFQGNRKPVESVSWEDVQVFISRLNAQQSGKMPEGWAYALPTEAQWEYACRAETTSMYHWGDNIGTQNANYQDSGLSLTAEVGQYPSNNWGFHDMHGNVAEWVRDRYLFSRNLGSLYSIIGQSEYSSSSIVDPINRGTEVPTLSDKVIRGGSWKSDNTSNTNVTSSSSIGEDLRSAARGHHIPAHRNDGLGFRVSLQKL